MLAQKIISGGYETYSTAVSLAFLKKAFDHSLPSLKKETFLSLEEEEKAIDEIAELIIHCVIQEKAWWLGGLSFTVYSLLSFQPLADEESEEGDPTWGKLNLKGADEEIWLPLDGYQRMLGMFRALSKLSGKSRQALAESMIPVLIIPDLPLAECHEILLRMHKSARAIDRGKAIRTTINDTYATYAHWMMGEDEKYPGIIEKDLINWKTNTLTNRLEKFSTLSVLYDSAKMLDQVIEEQIVDTEQRYREISSIWTLLLNEFIHFRTGVNAPKSLPALRSHYLCLKPTGQLIIIAVLASAIQTQKELPLKQVIERLNAIPWEIDHPYWEGIAIVDGRVNGTTASITLTSRLIAYLISLPLSDIEIQKLEADYCKAKQNKVTTLPEPLQIS